MEGQKCRFESKVGVPKDELMLMAYKNIIICASLITLMVTHIINPKTQTNYLCIGIPQGLADILLKQLASWNTNNTPE